MSAKRWDPPVGTMFGLWRYLGPGGYRKGSRLVRVLCTGCNTEHLRPAQSIRHGLTERCNGCRTSEARVDPVCRFCGVSTEGKTSNPVSACMACDRRRCRNGTCPTCGIPRHSKLGQAWCKTCDEAPAAPPKPPCGSCGSSGRLQRADPPLCSACDSRSRKNGRCPCGAARYQILRCEACGLVRDSRGRARTVCDCAGQLQRLLACLRCGEVKRPEAS